MSARRAVDRTAQRPARRPESGRRAVRRPLQAREAVVVTTAAEPRASRADAVSSAPVFDESEASSRLDQLRQSVQALRTRAGNVDMERAMLTAGGILLPLGLVAIGLGWYGASHTPYEFEQIPYVISGGLLGVGFVTVGGFLYFGYWLTRMFNEQRAQGERLVEALDRLEERMAGAAPGDGSRAVNGAVRGGASAARAGGAFVATASGTMFHRPDCPVVADKSGLRKVSSAASGYQPCAICDPLSAD